MSAIPAGVFLCTAVWLDFFGQAPDDGVPATLEIRDDGSVQINGFPKVRTFGLISAVRTESNVSIIGAGTDMGFVVWGELTGASRGYELSWYMPGHFAVDGRFTIAKFGEATCDLARQESP